MKNNHRLKGNEGCVKVCVFVCVYVCVMREDQEETPFPQSFVEIYLFQVNWHKLWVLALGKNLYLQSQN